MPLDSNSTKKKKMFFPIQVSLYPSGFHLERGKHCERPKIKGYHFVENQRTRNLF
jgi:hypothetical protein